MEITYKLFGLTEPQTLTDVRLCQDGLLTNTEYSVIRTHIKDFESEFDALDYIKECDDFEHGIELIKTYSK